MILDFLGINNNSNIYEIRRKYLLVVFVLIICCIGCSNSSEVHNLVEGDIIDSAQNYIIYKLENDTYLYEIYNNDRVVIFRGIVYREPSVKLYDSRFLEVKWGCGTGVWNCKYFDLETMFMSETTMCPHYVKDGLVAFVVTEETGERILRLASPYTYSDFMRDIEMDFAPENKILIDATCLREIMVEADGLKIIYWGQEGEIEEKKIEMEW